MYIGAHLSAAGGIHTAVDRAESIGAESLQVFTQSPRAWRPTNHDPANFERFRDGPLSGARAAGSHGDQVPLSACQAASGGNMPGG